MADRPTIVFPLRAPVEGEGGYVLRAIADGDPGEGGVYFAEGEGGDVGPQGPIGLTGPTGATGAPGPSGAFAGYDTNGLVTQTSTGNITGRTIVSTDTALVVTNGDGVAGNPSLAITEANLSGIPQAGVTNLEADLAALDTRLDAAEALDAAAFPLGVGAYTAYTPVWGSNAIQPTIGNGTIVGLYTKVGRRVDYVINMTVGSTSTGGSGIYTWSLPVAIGGGANWPVGAASVVDISTGTRFGRQAFPFTTTTIVLVSEAGAFVAPISPMTFAVGDTVAISGTYMAAS